MGLTVFFYLIHVLQLTIHLCLSYLTIPTNHHAIPVASDLVPIGDYKCMNVHVFSNSFL